LGLVQIKTKYLNGPKAVRPKLLASALIRKRPDNQSEKIKATGSNKFVEAHPAGMQDWKEVLENCRICAPEHQLSLKTW